MNMVNLAIEVILVNIASDSGDPVKSCDSSEPGNSGGSGDSGETGDSGKYDDSGEFGNPREFGKHGEPGDSSGKFRIRYP